MSEEWGPWIEHNGKPVPHLGGKHVKVFCEWPKGEWTEAEVIVLTGYEPSWLWECYGRIGIQDGEAVIWGRAIRYCVRKPPAEELMDDMLDELPSPKVDA